MLYRIIVSRSDGNAFVEVLRSAVPAVFPDHSLFSGTHGYKTIDYRGREDYRFSWEVWKTDSPVILAKLTNDVHRVQLPAAIVAALPHTVPVK